MKKGALPGFALALLLVGALLVAGLPSALGTNISHILSDPQYSTFRALCEKTGVAAQVNSRTTITVLVPPNSVLDAALARTSLSTTDAFKVLSFHVLLDYFDLAKFKAITKHTSLITTLLQTTGQADGQAGFINVTVENGGQVHLGRADKGAPLVAVVQKEIFTNPYNLSVVSISAVLVPDGVGGAPAPAPAPVNLVNIIAQGKNYNTFLSLINSTGVAEILQSRDTPPGLTLFVPDDAAFAKLPKGVLSNLKNAQVVALLEFHGLPSFYTAQELSTLTDSQKTLASGSGGQDYEIAGIQLSKSGSPVVDSGFNKASVGATLYSQEPVAIYGVNSVLLPTDIFGQPPSAAPAPAPLSPAPSSLPTPSPAPGPSPLGTPVPSPSMAPSSLSSPPAPPPGSSSLGSTAPNSPSASSASSLGLVFPLCVGLLALPVLFVSA